MHRTQFDFTPRQETKEQKDKRVIDEMKFAFLRLRRSEYAPIAHLNRAQRRRWARENKKGKWAVR